MNHVIRGNTISNAWKQAINYLIANEGSSYNLIVEIDNPTQDDLDDRGGLNRILKARGDRTVETVANTIFPVNLDTEKSDRTKLYDNFTKLYGELRKIPANSRGTYFGRLVLWNYERNINFNQIEHTIQKLLHARNHRKIRVRYEMAIYDPLLDHESQMGFPCMSFISVKIREDYIDLTAVYRSQYFIEKAYGNYLGLGLLLEFLARHSGFLMGKVTCISTHATLEKLDRENYTNLVQMCSGLEQSRLDI